MFSKEENRILTGCDTCEMCMPDKGKLMCAVSYKECPHIKDGCLDYEMGIGTFIDYEGKYDKFTGKPE